MNTTVQDPTKAEFLKDKKILIIDSAKSFSKMLQKSLVESGSSLANIKIATSADMAREFLAEAPRIVISEYSIDGVSGLEFIKTQREHWPSQKDRICLIITANPDQTSMVAALEEAVDGYMLKPFSVKAFIGTLDKIINAKINPSKLQKLLFTAEHMADVERFAEAERIFRSIIEVSKRPAVAWAAFGEMYNKQGLPEKAIECFDEGLRVNPSHFRSLRCKYETLEKMNKLDETYAALMQFNEHLLLPPKMLAHAMQLCVKTGNYADISKLYEQYSNMEQRSEELVESAGNALFECAQLAHAAGDKAHAEKIFTWCIQSSGRDVDLVVRVVHCCVDLEELDLAERLFKLYPSNKVGTPHYANADFYLSKHFSQPIEIVEKGRQLIAGGNGTVEIYAEVIRQLLKLDLRTAAENIAMEANRKFPDEKEMIQEALG